MEPRRESNKRRDESTNTNGFNKKKRLNHAGDTTEKRKEGNPAKKIKANNYPQKKARAEENGNRANKRRNKEEDSMLNIVQEQDLVQKQKRAEERDQVGEPSEQQEAGEVVEEIEEMEEIEDTGEEVENTKGGAHKNVPDNLLLFQYYKVSISNLLSHLCSLTPLCSLPPSLLLLLPSSSPVLLPPFSLPIPFFSLLLCLSAIHPSLLSPPLTHSTRPSSPRMNSQGSNNPCTRDYIPPSGLGVMTSLRRPFYTA